MSWRGAALSVLAVLTLPVSAAAQDAPPTVDLEDLPALPEPGEGEAASRVALVAAAEVEEDVVVGAGKREQSLGNVASAVTVISGDRLRRFGYRTVGEAIRGVAGVFLGDDRMTERIGIRGLHVLGDFNTRILVLVDGATVNEPWGHFAGVGWDAPITIDDVARLEVIRGPVSSLYGTNAFFGIINIVTRGAAEAPRAWGRVSGSQFAGGALAAGFAAGGVARQVRGSIAGVYRGGETLAPPPQLPGGAPIDADRITGLSGSLVGAWGGAFAQARFYRRDRQLPYAPYRTTVGDDRTHNRDQQLLVEGGYTRAVSSTVTVTGRAYASRYRFIDYLVYQPDDDNFQDFGDADWAGAELRGRWELLDRRRLGATAGGEATVVQSESRSHYEGMAADGIVVTTPFSIQGLYAELDGQPTDWLAFTGGLRFDRHALLDDRVSPRAAVFLSRGDRHGLKLLYAEGFRNPSPYEGFFEDGIDFEANPAIRAETIRSYELVLWARPRAGLSTRLSAFRWHADAIVAQTVNPDSGLLQFQNLGTRTSAGVEVEASYRDAGGWLAYGGGTWARVAGEAGRGVAGAPALVAAGGVSSPRLAARVHASTELHLVSARATRDPAVRAPPFVGWNLALYAPDLRGVDLTVGVRNLLGRRERVPAQDDYDRTGDLDETIIVPVLPGEGRELHVRIGYRFE
jgi:outer membrane receptor for ferrienterochelin and colicins